MRFSPAKFGLLLLLLELLLLVAATAENLFSKGGTTAAAEVAIDVEDVGAEVELFEDVEVGVVAEIEAVVVVIVNGDEDE